MQDESTKAGFSNNEQEREKARVLLVDGHKILRDGLRMLITRHEGLEICGEA